LFALFAGYASMNGMVAWSGPDPDPAALFALRDRFARLVERWHWMLRLVDLPAALQARPWPSGVTGEVAFRVEDPVCPWNSGTWRLELAGGQGRVAPAPPSTRAATADVRGLASLFTGFAGPDDLLRAGLLAGFDQDAVDLLRAAFASPRPWTAEFY
jgi:predicted acetyltransferase